MTSVTDQHHHVIVPPPTALNPIPALPTALRIDNKERLVELLLTQPTDSNNNNNTNANINANFRQLLVFGKENLRTLLLRQVLDDPHTRTFGKQKQQKNNKKNKNSNHKNWDEVTSFPLPKSLHTNVIGTKLLLKKKTHHRNPLHPQRHRTTWIGLEEEEELRAEKKDNDDDGDDDVFRHPDELFQHVDVITYFLRPWDLDQTMAVIHRIKDCAITTKTNTKTHQEGDTTSVESTTTSTTSSSKSHKQYHRIVYVPQISAMCTQIFKDYFIIPSMTNSGSVSIQSLQLDLFPLESDLLSLEYGNENGGLVEAGNIEGTPSSMIETISRALRKLQDVVGPIQRIQSLGIWGEEVLTKLLNETVDERYANEAANGGDAFYGEYDETEELEENDDDGNDDDSMNEEKKNEYNDEEGDDDGNATNTSNTTVMMLLDRRLDMVTPMVTPLTYEGLLDELVGIDCGFIHVDEQIINPKEDDDDDENENEGNDKGSRKKKDDKKSKSKSTTENSNPFDDDNNNATSSSSPPPPPLVSLCVHAGDTLFAEVRDQHVEKFGSFLQNQAIALKESHANFTNKDTKKNLTEIHQFVKQIPIFTQSLRSLTNHIHLAELIKATTEHVTFRDQWNTERAMIEGESCYDIIEECILDNANYPPYKLLRLMCLQSLCNGGIKSNRYDTMKQYIIQVYGYEFLPIVTNLEKMGFLKRLERSQYSFVTNALAEGGAGSGRSTHSLFQNLKKNLILIHAEVDTTEPDDISYVSSGYAPLTVRLIQSAMQGWGSSSTNNINERDDMLKDLFQLMSSMNNVGSSSTGNSGSGGNRLLDIKQTYPPRDLPTTLRRQRERQQQQYQKARGQQRTVVGMESLGAYGKRKTSIVTTTHKKKKPTLIVVYIGGITYMEMASLRFLSKRDSFPYHIIVITTKVLNGTKLIQSMG